MEDTEVAESESTEAAMRRLADGSWVLTDPPAPKRLAPSGRHLGGGDRPWYRRIHWWTLLVGMVIGGLGVSGWDRVRTTSEARALEGSARVLVGERQAVAIGDVSYVHGEPLLVSGSFQNLSERSVRVLEIPRLGGGGSIFTPGDVQVLRSGSGCSRGCDWEPFEPFTLDAGESFQVAAPVHMTGCAFMSGGTGGGARQFSGVPSLQVRYRHWWATTTAWSDSRAAVVLPPGDGLRPGCPVVPAETNPDQGINVSFRLPEHRMVVSNARGDSLEDCRAVVNGRFARDLGTLTGDREAVVAPDRFRDGRRAWDPAAEPPTQVGVTCSDGPAKVAVEYTVDLPQDWRAIVVTPWEAPEVSSPSA